MENINTILKEKGLSKQGLASRMNISRENLYRILNGNPTLENIKKIANALEVEVWELFTNTDQTMYGVIIYKGISHTIRKKKDLEQLLNIIE